MNGVSRPKFGDSVWDNKNGSDRGVSAPQPEPDHLSGLAERGLIPIMHGTPPLTRWHSLDERFWAFVNKTDTCWLYTGRLSEKGYAGRIGHEGRCWYGHQLAYTLLVGEIPTGLVIDHLCRVRHCVNPAHMEPVTAEENTRRGTDARWLEDCPNGHPPALYRRTLPSGKTVCVQCRRDADARRHERDREKRAAKNRANYYARKKKAA